RTSAIYTLSLHDALPIFDAVGEGDEIGRDAGFLEQLARRSITDPLAEFDVPARQAPQVAVRRLAAAHQEHASVAPDACTDTEDRSEEHTSELQSRENLVC